MFKQKTLFLRLNTVFLTCPKRCWTAQFRMLKLKYLHGYNIYGLGHLNKLGGDVCAFVRDCYKVDD